MNRRRRRAVLVVAAATAAAAVTVAAWPAHEARSSAAGSGDVLGRAPETGKLRLLAFLATQPDTAASASRSQAVGLVSLVTQYGGRGLTSQLVDESGADRDALINTYYDWRLGDIRVTADAAHDLARRYGVTGVPAVLLLDASGAVIQRWDSGVSTAQAAQVIASDLAG